MPAKTSRGGDQSVDLPGVGRSLYGAFPVKGDFVVGVLRWQ
jgi:hypothetical protein